MRSVFNHILFILVLLSGTFLKAQTVLTGEEIKNIDIIKDCGLNKSEAMDLLSWLCDVYGQRLNWSPEFLKAGKWAAEKLTEWGLTNVHFEGFTPRGQGWTLKKFNFNTLTPWQFPLLAYPKAWSPPTDGRKEGKIIIFDAATEDDLDKYRGKLQDAFLLMNEPIAVLPHFKPDAELLTDSALTKLAEFVPFETKVKKQEPDSVAIKMAYEEYAMKMRKLEFCTNEGAAAFLYSNEGDDGTVRVQGLMVANIKRGSDTSSSHQSPPRLIPQIVIAAEQYNRLYRATKKNTPITAEMLLDAAYTEADSNYNLIAEIPGTDLKDEIVMIGAHLDSWHTGTGATDNGTGVAAVMEAARIIVKNNLKPRRTIRIALWGGEEMGLWGSRSYVYTHLGNWLKESSIKDSNAVYSLKVKPEYYKFSAYFNYDNGAGKIRGLYLQGNKEARQLMDSWLTAYNDSLVKTTTLITKGSSDQKPFNDICLPSFLFIQDPLDYNIRSWHTNMDVVDRVSENDLKQSASVIAVMAWLAANSDQQVPRKRVQYNPD